jgi:hypothetical protein
VAYTIDLSGSYQHVDGVETLTYAKRNADGSKTNTTIYGRRGLSARTEYGGGDFAESSRDVEWALWPGAVTVAVGDAISDGSKTYLIMQQTDRRGDGSQVVVMTTEQV